MSRVDGIEVSAADTADWEAAVASFPKALRLHYIRQRLATAPDDDLDEPRSAADKAAEPRVLGGLVGLPADRVR